MELSFDQTHDEIGTVKNDLDNYRCCNLRDAFTIRNNCIGLRGHTGVSPAIDNYSKWVYVFIYFLYACVGSKGEKNIKIIIINKHK